MSAKVEIVAASVAVALIVGGALLFGIAKIIAALIALGLIGCLVVHPGLFLFLTVVPYAATQILLRQVPTVQAGSLVVNAGQAVMVGLVILFAIRLLAELAMARTVPRPLSAHWIQAAFVGWCAVSVVRVPTADGGAVLGRVLSCAAILYIGYWLGLRHRKWVLATLAGVAFVASCGAVIDRMYFGRTGEIIAAEVVRSRGAFTTAVATGVIAFAGLPVFAEYWLRRTRPGVRLVGVLGLCSFAVCIALTLTRTVLFGIVVFTLCLIGVSLPSKRSGMVRTLLKGALPLLLIIGGLLFVPSQYLTARYADFTAAFARDDFNPEAGRGRVGIWSAIVDATVASTPIELVAGHGIGSVWDVTEKAMHYRYDSHNSYLSVIYDMGLIGLLLFVSAMAACGRRLWRSAGDPAEVRDTKYIWFSYLVGYALSTIMFNGYVYSAGPQWFTYLGIGCAMAVGRSHSRDMR